MLPLSFLVPDGTIPKPMGSYLGAGRHEKTGEGINAHSCFLMPDGIILYTINNTPYFLYFCPFLM